MTRTTSGLRDDKSKRGISPLSIMHERANLELPPATVKGFIEDGEELALLDVREEGEFARGHLLYAVSLPLSQLELVADALVPRRRTRVIVLDGDGGTLAQRASTRLFELGWKNIAVLKGGVEAWRQAGYEVFSGVNVPSKAFGEFVEHEYGTPHIEPAEFKRRTDAGEEVLVLDSRPLAEFEAMSIPGGIDCPGAELVYRVHDLVKSPKTLVVVNCAGRTRSIIGAQSLINAGLENPVMALKDGTMGWHLAGFELAHGAGNAAPPPSPEGLAKARAAADHLARRFGVRRIDSADLADLEAEADRFSLYRFDVRSPEEYRAGHLRGWRSAPGGQLVQATDRYVGTLRSRLVLGDTDSVRAALTASWLIQMGWENVFTIEIGLDGTSVENGPEPVQVLGDPGPVAEIDAKTLQSALERGEAVALDFATSLRYRAGHIAGAWWVIRSRLAQALERLPPTGTLVATSPDGVLARLASADLRKITDRPVVVLNGGSAAWRDAGLPMTTGTERMADEPINVWYRPYDQAGPVEAAMRTYLAWEVELPERIKRDGTARFRAFR